MQRRIVSLGGVCEVAYQIKLHTDKQDADYFDWLITPFDALIEAVRNDFRDFFKLQDLKIHSSNKCIVNVATGVYYFHDFPLDENRSVLLDFEVYYDNARSKFTHLMNKFLSLGLFDGQVVFVRRELTLSAAETLCETLESKFPKLNFKLICVNSDNSGCFQAPSNRIERITVPRSGKNGLGESESWCQELKRIGLTDTGYKKTYAQIVKVGRNYVFE